MKFLCPQCKAKYRIADEKLAERATSKMKCRKCGHVIDIHGAAVPESRHPPPPDASSEGSDESPRVGVPRVVPAAGSPAGASLPKRPAVAAPPPRRGPAVPAPKRAAAPQRRGGAAVAQAVAEAQEEQSPTLRQNEPPPKNEFEDDAPTRIHDGGALTAAFSFSMGDQIGPPGQQPLADEWYVGIDGSPVGPLTFAALKEKAAAGKATPESLVWKEGFEDWKPLSAFPELVAMVEEAKRAVPAGPSVVIAASPAPTTKFISEPPGDLLEELGMKPKRKAASHPAAWAAIIVAMAFGVTLGIVLFSKTERHEVVKYVEVPASARAEQAGPGEEAEVIEEATVSANGTSKRIGGVVGKAEGPAPQASAGKGLLSGLSGLNGLGPSGNTGPDVASGNAPGGQLDGASIQRVVANFTPSVRRGCWQPALEGRGPDAPSSARVGLTITVSSSGNVENVSTTGDPKGYPNLARCIESRVKGWKFPRSSGTTTVQVPFVFAAQ